MKKTKFRRLAVMTASLLCCLIFTVPAYAQSNEPQPEATPAPVETEAEPETQNPFTPDGTGTVVDNATDEDGKEFYTITTADESEEVTPEPEPEPTEPVEDVPEPEPEPEPEKPDSSLLSLLLVGAVVLIGGGAGYYFKIYKPKHEAPDLEDDYCEYEDGNRRGTRGRGYPSVGRGHGRTGGPPVNFTNSPFERMMKEVPWPGRGSDDPCTGCRYYKECKGRKRQCRKKFRALIVEPRPSGHRGPKS